MGIRFWAAMVAGAATAGAMAAVPPAASDQDKQFVAEVSQGGLYEVEAGRIAAMRGQSPNVKDFGTMDAHDHALVNANLKRIAAQTGVTIQPGLNAEFSARLAKLKAQPAEHFDAYYMNDIKDLHEGDEAKFQKEAKEGSQPYQNFATQSATVVAGHLGWLNAVP